jgi:hypothetical protein
MYKEPIEATVQMIKTSDDFLYVTDKIWTLLNFEIKKTKVDLHFKWSLIVTNETQNYFFQYESHDDRNS